MTIHPQIISQDSSYLFIYKPSGLHSASLSENEVSPSVAQWLQKRFPQYRTYGYSLNDSGLLNRLDKETSGILMVAKSMEARNQFLTLTKQDKIIKRYLGACEGALEKKVAITTPIGSRSRSSKTVRAVRNPRKKDRALPAKTVATGLSFNSNYNCSVIRIEITQGRRHQIRAHLASIGHPLIGDTLYGSKSDLCAKLNIEEQFLLHCSEVKFGSYHVTCNDPKWVSLLRK